MVESDTSEIRILEMNPFGLFINIFIYQSYSLVSYLRLFGNYQYETLRQERIKNVQCGFVIIVQIPRLKFSHRIILS